MQLSPKPPVRVVRVYLAQLSCGKVRISDRLSQELNSHWGKTMLPGGERGCQTQRWFPYQEDGYRVSLRLCTDVCGLWSCPHEHEKLASSSGSPVEV